MYVLNTIKRIAKQRQKEKQYRTKTQEKQQTQKVYMTQQERLEMLNCFIRQFQASKNQYQRIKRKITQLNDDKSEFIKNNYYVENTSMEERKQKIMQILENKRKAQAKYRRIKKNKKEQ